MAASRFSSNGPDWKDVTRALLAIQESMQAVIVVSMCVAGSEQNPKLLLTATALSLKVGFQGPATSASASVSMPSTGAGDLCAALLSLGYELDKDWYRREQGIAPETA